MEKDFEGDVPFIDKSENWSEYLYHVCFILSLPVVVFLSACGMIVIKTGEMKHDMIILITGLALESLAFMIYPISMRVYQLRTITVCWSGGSILAGVFAGYLFFDEVPTLTSLIGCMIVITGIIISVV